MSDLPLGGFRRRVVRGFGRLQTVQRLALLGAIAAVVLTAIVVVPNTPAADSDEPQLREFTLTAEEIDWELQPGTKVRAWAYNGQMPGPEIRVREGDRVKVTLINKLPVATTIHWHGVDVPPDQDGPAGLNQAPVEPGETFTYEFTATPAGTRWYHSHTDVATQVLLGLYGPFIVEPKDQAEEYDRDNTYILTEWDSELTPDVATGKAPRGPRDSQLRGGEFGTDLFLMNGHIHEAIPPIVVSEGDTVLLRLINAGNVPHPFHTHGHSFRIVATDGNPVPREAQLTKDTVLVAPGERYDIVFEANNPGVWMAHCHIENHAANGMMTVIQYEGSKPSGPLAEFWELTPSAESGKPAPSRGGDDMGGMMTGHARHGTSAESTPELSPTAAASVETSAASTPTAATEGGAENTATIVMEDDRFGPKSLTVKVGTTVTWINNGRDWHSVAAFDGSFEAAEIASGESFSHTFTTPGTFKFICKHHARHGMIGEVIVTA